MIIENEEMFLLEKSYVSFLIHFCSVKYLLDRNYYWIERWTLVQCGCNFLEMEMCNSSHRFSSILNVYEFFIQFLRTDSSIWYHTRPKICSISSRCCRLLFLITCFMEWKRFVFIFLWITPIHNLSLISCFTKIDFYPSRHQSNLHISK